MFFKISRGKFDLYIYIYLSNHFFIISYITFMPRQLFLTQRLYDNLNYFPLHFKINFIYFWLYWVFTAACGLFSSCSEQGLLFVVVRGLLIAVASLVAEHGL